MRKQHRQQGATLIEVLVSLLIMSLGLLGVAGMQLNAIAYQKNSWSTHRVVEITTDIAERIRSNIRGANLGSYNYTAAYEDSHSATFTKNDCRTSGAYCSTAQIAADDIADFVTKAQTILPGGSGLITGNPERGFEITVMFMDKEFVNTDGELQRTPNCLASTAGIDWRNCCPDAVGVPAPRGLRCRRSSIMTGS